MCMVADGADRLLMTAHNEPLSNRAIPCARTLKDAMNFFVAGLVEPLIPLAHSKERRRCTDDLICKLLQGFACLTCRGWDGDNDRRRMLPSHSSDGAVYAGAGCQPIIHQNNRFVF